MPIHDWTRVDAGLFHDFHQSWSVEIRNVLNGGVLPADYYALVEQHAAGFGPDVLTLQIPQPNEENESNGAISASIQDGNTSVLTKPRLEVSAETDMEFYRRRQNTIAVRHVSGDRVVAMIEIISPGNKNTRYAIEAFVRKVAELLDRRIHLLIIDLIPPGNRDPHGIHASIWEYIAGEEVPLPMKPLSLISYETDLTVKAYVVPIAIGEVLPDMPLCLEPQAAIDVPLELTYQTAYRGVPRRWKAILEQPNP